MIRIKIIKQIEQNNISDRGKGIQRKISCAKIRNNPAKIMQAGFVKIGNADEAAKVKKVLQYNKVVS